MPQIPSSTSPAFLEFAERVTSAAFIEQLALNCQLPAEHLRQKLVVAAGEAGQTLRVLSGLDIVEGGRLLEVGAGMGMTSAYLSSQGFDMTALEPGGVGFEENLIVSQQFALLLGSEHEVLSIGVEELDASCYGQFALVYSNNVLEHVDDPAAALRSLAPMMTPDGVMAHSCPNYTVPFEPHFNIPLLPIRPQWTARLLPRSISKSSVWESLNFIRARDVSAAVNDLGLKVHFRSGALATSLDRLNTDAKLAERHPWLAFAVRPVRRLGLIALLRRLPATWSTPMDFLICCPHADQARVASWLARGQDA